MIRVKCSSIRFPFKGNNTTHKLYFLNYEDLIYVDEKVKIFWICCHISHDKLNVYNVYECIELFSLLNLIDNLKNQVTEI